MVAAPELKLPRTFAQALRGNLDEVEIVSSGDREVLVGFLKRPASESEIDRANRVLESHSSIAGIVLRCDGFRRVLGEAQISVEIEEGVTISADADLFSQVNRAQNRKLIAEVMEMAEIRDGAEVLDLFCGAGNLSLPASRRGARVTGIDSDTLAIAAAERKARVMNLANTKFVAGKASEAAQFLIRAKYRPATIILDPPRIGAAELIAPIIKLRPRAIVYVSCDIATLARDLRGLIAGGYRVKRLRGFDFFPNTHHIETAAKLLLT
jgi:23S rRNA (uracil1939-C5)-methyltransferase